MDVKWFKTGNGNLTNIVEYTADPLSETSSWITAAMTTKSRFTIEHLESVGKYWVRVTAVGKTGKSNPSDPGTARAK